MAYDWPGNIRQLQNVVEHGMIISNGPVFRPPVDQLQGKTSSLPRTRRTLDDAVRDHILQALEQTRWVVGGRNGTAAYLGVARTTLLAKMRRLGIESVRSGAARGSANAQSAVASMA
jgi:formate hydrogenlyase transcriptional activator